MPEPDRLQALVSKWLIEKMREGEDGQGHYQPAAAAASHKLLQTAALALHIGERTVLSGDIAAAQGFKSVNLTVDNRNLYHKILRSKIVDPLTICQILAVSYRRLAAAIKHF